MPGNRHLTLLSTEHILPSLRTTPLDSLNRRLGARMVPFAGWSLPVQFPAGTLAEHAHARTRAAVFDVSHMAQISLPGDQAARLERLVPRRPAKSRPRPPALHGLPERGRRHHRRPHGRSPPGPASPDRKTPPAPWKTLPTSRPMASPRSTTKTEHCSLCKAPRPRSSWPDSRLKLPLCPSSALRPVPFPACQTSGSAAAAIPAKTVSRCPSPPKMPKPSPKYSLPNRKQPPPASPPATTLRLEAGLCLYGNDIDMLTSPIEAGLAWTIPKRRRAALDFIGASVIHDHLTNGTTRPAHRHPPLRPSPRPSRHRDRRPRRHTRRDDNLRHFLSPAWEHTIAMGYVRQDLVESGSPLSLLVRRQRIEATQASLPFVPHRFAAK